MLHAGLPSKLRYPGIALRSADRPTSLGIGGFALAQTPSRSEKRHSGNLQGECPILLAVRPGADNVTCMAEVGQAESSSSFGADIFCPVCGYSLHTAPADKCPECGHSLANLRHQECQIPWTRCRTAGRFRTFWQTVWLVTFRPLRFWEEYAHIVPLRDARLFQVVTVLHVYLPAIVATLLVYATTPFEPEVGNPMQQMMTTGFVKSGPTVVDRMYAEVWPVVILHICLILFLLTATGVPSYFFHPRSVAAKQQDNAVAMSIYACAPLAFYPVLVLVICILARVVSLDRWGLAYLLAPRSWPDIGLFASGAVCVVAWWWGLLRLMQRTMPLHKQRRAALGTSLPFIWFGLAVLFLGFLPLLVLYILLVIVSLVG